MNIINSIVTIFNDFKGNWTIHQKSHFDNKQTNNKL